MALDRLEEPGSITLILDELHAYARAVYHLGWVEHQQTAALNRIGVCSEPQLSRDVQVIAAREDSRLKWEGLTQALAELLD